PGLGVGWAFDIVSSVNDGSQLGACIVHEHSGFGHATVVIDHDNDNSIESSSLVGTYFHKFIGANGELTFSSNPSISISPSYNYDRAQDVPKQFNWYHQDYNP